MLEKPAIRDDQIIACLADAYGLPFQHITFLPLGADGNAAAYRAVTADGTPYFVKLRQGVLDPTAVALTQFLSERGMQEIIAPIETRSGQLWTDLDAFNMILNPFVEGENGRKVVLSEDHWRQFGSAVKRLHTLVVPPALARNIPQETYTSRWRDGVRRFLALAGEGTFEDPVAAELAAFLNDKQAEILYLVDRAGELAQAVQSRRLASVLCHADVHASNILIDACNRLYIVDWDDPVLAPKERDLMFIGGAQGFAGYSAEEEETLFYRGYGPAQINANALAYYRYERIVQDIAVFCQQLLLTEGGGQDREQALGYVKSNFVPGGTIEMARRADATPVQSRREHP